jgi:DNA-binding GntR family transcriptional regulator
MLVDTWRHLEGRIRVVIMAAGPIRAQPLMSPDRHEPIITAIENGDPSAAVDAIHGYMANAANHFAPGPRRP